MRDIFEEMERIRQEMEPILGEIFRGRQMLLPLQQPGKCLAKCTPAGLMPAGWVPARNALADIKETETNVIAAIEVPGIDKKDIEVNANEGSIEVKAFRQSEKHEKKGNAESCESRSIRFYRILQLPAKVNPDKATATCKDGILRVEMPKIKPEAKKRIEIR